MILAAAEAHAIDSTRMHSYPHWLARQSSTPETQSDSRMAQTARAILNGNCQR